MEKKTRLSRCLLLYAAGAGVGFCFWMLVLAGCGLMFRQWVYTAAAAVILLGGIAGVVQLILWLKSRAGKAVLLVLFALVLAFEVFPVLLVFYAFGEQEYVVEREGKQYVVYVRQFLKTWAEYYDYRNFLVAGNRKRIEEFYGKQYFDPEDMEHNREAVVEITYYDEDGNAISGESEVED